MCFTVLNVQASHIYTSMHSYTATTVVYSMYKFKMSTLYTLKMALFKFKTYQLLVTPCIQLEFYFWTPSLNRKALQYRQCSHLDKNDPPV